MTDYDHDPAWADWLKDRPESVQRLATEFPPDVGIVLEGVIHYVIGYTEGDRLILSPVDPSVDLEAAHEEKVYLCASHVRGLRH